MHFTGSHGAAEKTIPQHFPFAYVSDTIIHFLRASGKNTLVEKAFFERTCACSSSLMYFQNRLKVDQVKYSELGAPSLYKRHILKEICFHEDRSGYRCIQGRVRKAQSTKLVRHNTGEKPKYKRHRLSWRWVRVQRCFCVWSCTGVCARVCVPVCACSCEHIQSMACTSTLDTSKLRMCLSTQSLRQKRPYTHMARMKQ